MPESPTSLEALDGAVQVLKEAGVPVAYRDLNQRLSESFPTLTRSQVSDLIMSLVALRSDCVWRPRPGYFAIRSSGDPVARPGRLRQPRHRLGMGRTWTSQPLPNHTENLVRLGFEPVGEWNDGDEFPRITLGADAAPEQVLVAIALGSSVVYISQYSRMTQGLGRKVQRAHEVARQRGQAVSVYALQDWDRCEHRGIPVNMAAGLEAELIERMQPPWNAS